MTKDGYTGRLTMPVRREPNLRERLPFLRRTPSNRIEFLWPALQPCLAALPQLQPPRRPVHAIALLLCVRETKVRFARRSPQHAVRPCCLIAQPAQRVQAAK